AKYDMAKDMEESLKAYQKQIENEFASKQKKFENDYADYMKNGASLTLTQQKETEKKLQQRANELQQLQPQLATQLQERQINDNKKLLDAVYAFIKDYNLKHDKFDIIFAKSYISSPVLYIDETMDITEEIIKGLNEEYKEYKKDN
ncbi:MAG: OmpH family outer membrane protein, partial [Bacteroidales bacterium]|nr:OmpH family outer membrane protein [Bacteroidales bacterium]